MKPTRVLIRGEYRNLSEEDEDLLRAAFQTLMRLGAIYQKAPIGSCSCICDEGDGFEFIHVGAELHLGAALRRALERVNRDLPPNAPGLNDLLPKIDQDKMANALQLALESLIFE
jgi:hypothetical protein